MNGQPTKFDRIRMHWQCLRRDCHHAWFHLKGIGREFCLAEQEALRSAPRGPRSPVISGRPGAPRARFSQAQLHASLPRASSPQGSD